MTSHNACPTCGEEHRMTKQKMAVFGSDVVNPCNSLNYKLGYLKDSNAAAHSVDTGIR